jgi:hypothetical protein
MRIDTCLTTYEKNDYYCTTSPTEHTINNNLQGFLYLIHQSHTSFYSCNPIPRPLLMISPIGTCQLYGVMLRAAASWTSEAPKSISD